MRKQSMWIVLCLVFLGGMAVDHFLLPRSVGRVVPQGEARSTPDASAGAEAFVGAYSKTAGNFFFNGSLESVRVTIDGGTPFVQIVCSCDVRGKYVAELRDNRLRFSVPFQGEAFAVWLEKGRKLNVLGDEFTRTSDR